MSFSTRSFVALSLCALGLTGVTACGGGGGGGAGGGGSSASGNTGQIVDALVEGLHYSSGSFSGLTDVNGHFEYEAGGEVTFSVGDIVLGTVDGSSVLTIVDLVPGTTHYADPNGPNDDHRVLNIARCLQTIDVDSKPRNGIKISAATRAAAAGQTINFDQDTGDWESDPEVLATLGLLTDNPDFTQNYLVDAEEAAEHGNGWLVSARAGEYSGTWILFDEDDGHKIDFSISNQGDICVTMEWPRPGGEHDDVILASSAFATYKGWEYQWAPTADGYFYIRNEQEDGLIWEWEGRLDGETIVGELVYTEPDNPSVIGGFTASLTHKEMSFLDMEHVPELEPFLYVNGEFFGEDASPTGIYFYLVLDDGYYGCYGLNMGWDLVRSEGKAPQEWDAALQVTSMTDTVIEFRGWSSRGVWITGEFEVLDTEVIVSGSWVALAGTVNQESGTFSGSEPLD